MGIKNFVRYGTTQGIVREPWLMADQGRVCASNGVVFISRKPEAGEKWPVAGADVIKAFGPLLDVKSRGAVKVNTSKLRQWAGKPKINARWDNAYPGMSVGILNGIRINKCWLSLILKTVDDEELVIGKVKQTTGDCLSLRGDRWRVLLMEVTLKNPKAEEKKPASVFVA